MPAPPAPRSRGRFPGTFKLLLLRAGTPNVRVSSQRIIRRSIFARTMLTGFLRLEAELRRLDRDSDRLQDASGIITYSAGTEAGKDISLAMTRTRFGFSGGSLIARWWSGYGPRDLIAGSIRDEEIEKQKAKKIWVRLLHNVGKLCG